MPRVPEAELVDAAFSFKRILREKGKLWIAVPGHRPGLNAEHRDGTARLFRELHPEYLVLLFERLGFQLLTRLRGFAQSGKLFVAQVFA